jgi:sugar lactone lactonase YvrE
MWVIAFAALMAAACGSASPSSQTSRRPEGTVAAALATATASPTVTASPPVAAAIVPASPIPALDARLIDPIGLVFDAAGNLYVSDCWEPTDSYIFRIDPNGLLTTFAGKGIAGFSGDGGPATSANIHCPLGMAFGPDRAFYFADHVNNRIRRIDAAGIITTVAGSGPAGVNQGSFSGDGGPATNATLQEPYAVAFDRAGNLYISDRDNNRIRKVDTKGIITTIAGNGKTGYSGDGVLGSQTSIEYPLGIITDSKGDVIFVDANNKRTRMIDAIGVIRTIAGTGKNAATGDGGPATKAALADPENLVFDEPGNLYVTDTVNNTLRLIDRRGIITTLASHRGGNGLAIDTTGNLYVTDADHNSVYRIDTKGGVILFAGQG